MRKLTRRFIINSLDSIYLYRSCLKLKTRTNSQTKNPLS